MDTLHNREGAREMFLEQYHWAWTVSGHPCTADIMETFVAALGNEFPPNLSMHSLWIFMFGHLQRNDVPLNWFSEYDPNKRHALEGSGHPMDFDETLEEIGKMINQGMREAIASKKSPAEEGDAAQKTDEEPT